MMKVDNFLLEKMESLVDFHKIVSNIMDWGIGKRLSDIQTSLESLELEKDSADSGMAAKNAKTRHLMGWMGRRRLIPSLIRRWMAAAKNARKVRHLIGSIP